MIYCALVLKKHSTYFSSTLIIKRSFEILNSPPVRSADVFVAY